MLNPMSGMNPIANQFDSSMQGFKHDSSQVLPQGVVPNPPLPSSSLFEGPSDSITPPAHSSSPAVQATISASANMLSDTTEARLPVARVRGATAIVPAVRQPAVTLKLPQSAVSAKKVPRKRTRDVTLTSGADEVEETKGVDVG